LTPLLKGYKCPSFGLEVPVKCPRFSKSSEREEDDEEDEKIPILKIGKYYKPMKWIVPQNKFGRSSKRKPIFDEREASS
jgi:hypothetical protein